MKAELTFTEEMLGTSSANADLHKEFIASKSADKEKMQEELESLPADELQQKAMTVFPRQDGSPFLWDYQVK
ncbi:MAG TPA: hypothetical protein PK442_10610, partial [Synergistales bacterium]|nr:hypothetical protein [Synergistales bacterium]